MILETRAAPPFHKNGYVAGCEKTREGVVIDPGDEVDALLEAVSAHKLNITGVKRAKDALGVPVGLHQADNFLYEAVVQQGRAFGFPVEAQPPVDFFYEPEGTLTFGNYVVRIRHTPGHCPGGVCLTIERADGAERSLFVGDTLFAGSIGRTDLPGGDTEVLLRSINEVLLVYPDETPVYSGHGAPTTIGREKRTNPFLI
jgi:hydroxyacylglutathione hydrolase